jgi:hypothetical protein
VIVEVAQANESTAADSSQSKQSGITSEQTQKLQDQALKAGAAAAVESIIKEEQDKKPQNSQF